jgi:DnaA family protein
MSAQLALPLTLADHAVFASFWRAGNEAAVAFLEQLARDGSGVGAWLSGGDATGKSHLLQALCASLGAHAVYVPLETLAGASPALLDGLASRRCVCIDDLDAVAGQDEWELALFALANSLADADGLLVASAAAPPRDCGFALPDLESRLAKLPAFRLAPLAEPERANALALRARLRGLELPPETARFLLRRARRDMRSLYALLDRLDGESLKAQRRLTIPFVRAILEGPAP